MNGRTTHQLVRYEALFSLLDDIQSVDDVAVIGQRVAMQWKYFADVSNWRLVILIEDSFLVMDGFRGESSVRMVKELDAWDRHHLNGRRPCIVDSDSQRKGPSPPAHLDGESLGAVFVLPFLRGKASLGVLSVAARHSPLNELDSKFIHLFGNYLAERVFDLMLRKRAEKGLQDSEESFRNFFESTIDIAWVMDAEGKILFSNRSATRILGYTPGELTARHILDVHSPGYRQEAASIFKEMLAGDRDTCPLPLLRKDGVLVPVETRIWHGRWHNQACIFGVSKDLSAEQEAMQLFEHSFRNNPALMALSVLPERRLADVNNSFLEITGYSRQEVIGKTTQELGLFPVTAQRDALEDTIEAQGRVHNREALLRGKDGALRDGIFFGEVIKSQGKDYLLSVMIDITERKKAEKFRTHVERIIHHDIRSPLSGLHAMATYALDEPFGDELREKIPHILNAVKRVIRLVDSSDKFIRMESGTYSPCSEWFDLRTTHGNIELALRTLAESKKVHVVRPGASAALEPNNVLSAYGEEFLIEDMLMNLVRNAVEASPVEGVVTVSCHAAKDGMHIAIFNSGVVPEDVREVFFDKFATFGKPWGTGLGTYSAQLIAKAHGGRIGFISSQDEGTTVTVILPYPAQETENER